MAKSDSINKLMTEKKDLINKLGQVELTIHPVMIVLMKYTVRQLLRKVKSCIYFWLYGIKVYYV